jgi:hypothetical protein
MMAITTNNSTRVKPIGDLSFNRNWRGIFGIMPGFREENVHFKEKEHFKPRAARIETFFHGLKNAAFRTARSIKIRPPPATSLILPRTTDVVNLGRKRKKRFALDKLTPFCETPPARYDNGHSPKGANDGSNGSISRTVHAEGPYHFSHVSLDLGCNLASVRVYNHAQTDQFRLAGLQLQRRHVRLRQQFKQFQ